MDFLLKFYLYHHRDYCIPEDSPLRSGTIDVKYMTAKEEDILTSTNLIEQGKVITKTIRKCNRRPKS